MLRRALVLATAASLVATGVAAARSSAVEASKAKSGAFFVSGRGWGHGVGMSQWGAYGFAQRGTSYDRILAHYYRGAELGRAPLARVRVLLGEGKKAVAVSSDEPFSVRDGSGAVHELAGGAYSFGPGLRLEVDPEAGPQALPGPLVFLPGAAHLRYGGKLYRGQLQVNAGKAVLQIVNNVGLEQYLYGVVPREVPSGWPAEALKAQAVVARSYGLAVRKTGAFDLYNDVRSQVYGGVAAEKPTTSAAVDATAGQVLLFEGKVARTFFFSTSGGRTASVEHVWSGGTPIPYLVSVPDPYDNASPHHTWGPVAFTAAKLNSTFKVPGGVIDVRVARNGSQRAAAVTFVGKKGEVTVPAGEVRTKLGLRSTWFRFGLLALEPKPPTVVYGKAARLEGVVRGASKVTLERLAGKVWEPAARLVPARNGTVVANVKPLVSTTYRLAASPTFVGRPVRVFVAPRVTIKAVATPTALRGIVRPVLPGARVDVQRLDGSSWRVVASATVDASGAYEAALAVTPGTYRARVAPGGGFVPGVSSVLRVVG
jgi:stage II sporulation protein D